MIAKIFIVVEGGCVRYVSGTDQHIHVNVIDLDDMHEETDPEVIADNAVALKEAESLLRLW